MEKGKKAKNVQMSKKKSFFRKNFSIIIIILLSGMSIAINYYDKENSEMINVEVDKNLVKASSNNAQQKINIFIYNPSNKMVEEKEAYIPKQKNLVEGDYINEVIKDTNFLTKNMKFMSAYTLRIDGENTTIVKLNSEFTGLRSNQALFNGFAQSVSNTILKNFSNIKKVIIQIDGEAIIQYLLFLFIIIKIIIEKSEIFIWYIEIIWDFR